MFSAEMIAPCGLDCSLCMFAHASEKPCLGCNVDSDTKPAFCASWCKIIPCEKRVKNGYQYCDECPDYPCEDMMERETRYTTAYPLKESPMQNLWRHSWSGNAKSGAAGNAADRSAYIMAFAGTAEANRNRLTSANSQRKAGKENQQIRLRMIIQRFS